MKINADQSGNYILITDIHRRVVYCLECYTSFEDEGSCYIRSVNVCFIESPVLSFIISTVKERFIIIKHSKGILGREQWNKTFFL